MNRTIKDKIVGFVGIMILSVIFFILFDIFFFIFVNGGGAINFYMLTHTGDTTSGGILNAIVGTWELVGVALLISIPVGLFSAIYISEYSSSRFGSFLKIVNDLITGIPSIVLGLFGFLFLVIYLNFGYSLLAGGITLGITMIPYITRLTEMALSGIPDELRINAYALGANKFQTIRRILLRGAFPGFMAGIILAVSIGAGETAQLLYTAGWNNYFPESLTHSQVAYLTYVVWTGINQPSTYSHNLAYVSALVLVLTILALTIILKVVFRRVR